MANEEIALDKTGQGETSKKCFLPINPISAPVTFQRIFISGELCYISPPAIFPIQIGPANILYCLMMCFCAEFPHIPPACPPPHQFQSGAEDASIPSS